MRETSWSISSIASVDFIESNSMIVGEAEEEEQHRRPEEAATTKARQ